MFKRVYSVRSAREKVYLSNGWILPCYALLCLSSKDARVEMQSVNPFLCLKTFVYSQQLLAPRRRLNKKKESRIRCNDIIGSHDGTDKKPVERRWRREHEPRPRGEVKEANGIILYSACCKRFKEAQQQQCLHPMAKKQLLTRTHKSRMQSHHWAYARSG